MFIEVETDKGEIMSLNPNCIIAYWKYRRDKVCVLFVNDMTQNLDCSYEELQAKLNAQNGVCANNR